MSNVKVFLMMAGLAGLFAALGGAFGGRTGMLLALGFAGVLNFVMYYGSSTMVLKMYRARVVERHEAPELYGMVDRLRQRAGLPMPTVAIAPHAQPNAFATGRNPANAVVCVTEGLLQLTDRTELEGVIAHELAHIRNRDMLLQTVTATLAGAVSGLADLAMWSSIFGLGSDEEEGQNPLATLAMIIVAPIAAMLIQLAISRQREFRADAVGAQIAGRADGLASALRKLESAAHRIPLPVKPAAAPLAVVNPLSAFQGGLVGLFRTHPSTEERIARLQALRPELLRAA